MKDWAIFLIAAITIIVTVIIWNSYNSTSYRRLRALKSQLGRDPTVYRKRIKAGLRNIGDDIGDLGDDIGDLGDGVRRVWDDIWPDRDGYDEDDGGYDGEHGGYM
uniref:Transmembrane protein n=1 Tax=Marseillevirus LCMAC101 TaxID=2506602 RepID=A0A481YTR5_9VIRU|nr:MAG: hypothetical protein LCMAC101_04990 [Marseillevirus LCMAC101]